MISRISWATLALCLILAGTFVTGCDRPTASDATKSGDSASMPAGTILRADPNPVLTGNPDGTTTIIWDTGGNEVAEVYSVEAGNEKLLATGAKGAQEVTWIKPGTTEFRLYNQAGHKLLAQLKVTMSPAEVPPSNLSIKPLSSPSP